MTDRRDIPGDRAQNRALRLGVAACLGVPATVLLLAYLWLALDRGTLALFDVPVHESGRYTFVETVLYFRHFLREVPTDVAMALFVVASVAAVSPRRLVDAHRRRRAGVLSVVGLGGAALLCAVALAAVAHRHGMSEALHELLQYRTRDDLSEYGAHWHFHWLSTIWFGLACGVVASLAGPAAAGSGRAAGVAPAASTRIVQLAPWLFFLGLSAIFGVSAKSFSDPRYAGHQAREIVTHGPVTCLLGVGLVLLCARKLAPWEPGARPTRSPRAPVHGRERRTWVRAALFVAIPGYVAVVAVAGGVREHGQFDQGLSAVVAGHFFEHALDYLLVALLSVAFYAGLLLRGRTAEPTAESTAQPTGSARARSRDRHPPESET